MNGLEADFLWSADNEIAPLQSTNLQSANIGTYYYVIFTIFNIEKTLDNLNFRAFDIFEISGLSEQVDNLWQSISKYQQLKNLNFRAFITSKIDIFYEFKLLNLFWL